MVSMSAKKNNTNKSITIEKIGDTEYQISLPKQEIDATLQLEDGQWCIDIFNSTIKNTDKAHIESTILDKGNHSVTSPDWNEIFEFLQVWEYPMTIKGKRK